jgi:hypothetical protein
MVKPPTKQAPPKNALKGVRMSDDLVHRIDEWRRVQADIPSQGEAIRRLIELGLAASPKAGKRR